MPGGGEDLGRGLPEAKSPAADRQDRGTHPPAGAVTRQVRPGLARLAVSVLERDQLLAAVSAHADEDEYAGFGLLQADIEVDTVGPHIHVVDLGEIAVHERGVVGLPLLVNRVAVVGDSPAELPRNCSSAGAKSPEDRPCR